MTLNSALARQAFAAVAMVAAAALLSWALWLWIGWRAPALFAGTFAALGSLFLVMAVFWRQHSRHAQRVEQRLALAQDETGVGLFELDYRADTAYASPALCQILGQPVMAGSMPLQQWMDALNAGLVADSRRSLQEKVQAREFRYERELRLQLPDGRTHWLLSRIRLDVDAQGTVTAARGATLDITDRKQLLIELEASQSQLRQQLDDLHQLHDLSNRLLAMPSIDDALTAILQAACAFHGSVVGWLVLVDEPTGDTRLAAHCGLGTAECAQLTALLQPDAPDDGLRHRLGATEQRVVSIDLMHDTQFTALQPLARSLNMQALHNTPVAVPGASGQGCVLGTLTVLTAAPGEPGERRMRLTDLCAAQAGALIERGQALDKAAQTQRRFEVALQSSSVAFTILVPVRNEDGRVVDFAWSYANPAAAILIGRPAHALVGERILDVLPNAWDEPGVFARYVQVVDIGCTAEFDLLTQNPNDARWLHVILSPLSGSVVVWFADVTQSRRQAQALKDADRRKDEFLATLAHELRNPLAPMRHALGIMRNAAGTAVQRDWSLAVLDRQLQHMALLLDDLLDVSRINRGSFTLRRARSGLQAIVDTAVETAQPHFQSRQHRLVLDLPEEPLWLDVDPLRVAQVLSNLLVNAAKYTPAGGQVVLRAGCENGFVVLTVTDNGRGLQAGDCERVFEMFTQLQSAGEPSPGGLGIGLALSRRLVQMHGGTLTAHSPGPGEGSSFTARFPLADPATSPSPPPSPAHAPSPPIANGMSVEARRRLSILVADDNRDAADSLALLLRLQGHEVHLAYDGAEALAGFLRVQPQVALLDMGMPVHDGLALAAMIRQHLQSTAHQVSDGLAQKPERAAVMLVAITGFGQDRDRREAIEAGFDHHLTKPVQMDALEALISRVAM